MKLLHPHSNQQGVVPIPLLIAAIALIGFVVISSTAGFRDKLFSTLFPKPQSYASTTCKQMNVQVSSDTTSWTTSLTLSTGATKYYLEAVDATSKSPCDAYFDFTDVNTNTVTTQPYHTSGGVARIDIVGIQTGTYKYQVAAHGVNGSSSNPFSVTITNGPYFSSDSDHATVANADSSSKTDLTQHYNFKPGNILQYQDSIDRTIGGETYDATDATQGGNSKYQLAGYNRFQVENEETINCGSTAFSVFPIRYTADNINAYSAYGFLNSGSTLTRNFMVDSTSDIPIRNWFSDLDSNFYQM